MAQGHILTRSFEFETRQYKFGPLDVVDGVPRSMLTIGAPVVAVWCAVLWALFGPPNRLSVERTPETTGRWPRSAYLIQCIHTVMRLRRSRLGSSSKPRMTT